MTVAPLVGYRALRAVNAFHTLLMGLKMTPAYIGEPYEKFFEAFEDMPEAEKEKLLRLAVTLVPMTEEEVLAIAEFAKDSNGIAVRKEAVAGMKPDQLFEIVVMVGMEISRVKIDILSKDEKKK